MLVRDFDFDLPADLIAQEPPAVRGASRLLHLDRRTGGLTHTTITALPDRLRPGDLLVVNNTRVFPARLIGRRVPSGGAVECLLIRRVDEERWDALVHPGQKLKPGAELLFEGERGGPRIHGVVLDRRFHGRRTVSLRTDDARTVDEAIDAIGHVPLPPYIKRQDRGDDRERYQTVFARSRGSVAAPTAGLHFNPALMSALAARGIDVVEITLHVGYGTFQPVRVDRVEDHAMDSERYEIGGAAAGAITRARSERRRIIAVGTTTTRTLEAVARAHDNEVVATAGSTDLFIYPGFEFRVIDGLLTNFHVPRSSLLMLVSAFAGRERVLAAYEAAIAARYRFYSYGDAMLIT
jgi:S-adenosylmethionine:tRNA ribosyltransferase-isomerase